MIQLSNVLLILLVFLNICYVCGLFGLDNVFGSKSKVLSRRRRYVAFPDGSSFSCAGCIAIGLLGQPAPSSAPGTFTFGLNWAIAYELPNVTDISAYYRSAKRVREPMQQRRNRRDLYTKLESILDNMGYSGRQCILKTLCETTQRIVPHGENMVEEIFRALFTLPKEKVLSLEPLEHTIYDSAHRLGILLENCDAMFTCPISLVDWAKGHYDTPSPGTNTIKSPWALFSSNFS